MKLKLADYSLYSIEFLFVFFVVKKYVSNVVIAIVITWIIVATTLSLDELRNKRNGGVNG
ncbi:hypothetical protein JNUCC76_08620 [Leuconostoc sp. JNUCC 76]